MKKKNKKEIIINSFEKYNQLSNIWLHTFSNFSTNVQFACARRAGLSSVGAKFPDFWLDEAIDVDEFGPPIGGFPSIEISLARHFEPFLTRRKLFPLVL